ncbi:asparagine synthase (glutamine-hydrolysing) [Marisediminitalea aggregata]|jgi:asparagine synthase (glutamine-hydrolysing)|uniref:asparagine synthase (glutamine-hydrolyzing) n=1 Tax=Marisediminitalea aggregata TaxID=634436 RepID=A0A1M5REA3_9ALTE|nr:asparagine synthase B [Marisediminitalea aggregata]MAP20965.1 asparagine synthase B [Alteromonadaceae bacterium]MAX44484.1 asparagine synthase B [Alteromonadaceae bacterium]MEC7823298.1 asparagine synthase B [Pseudomonadota bacterium]SHH24655.1 asparagine synthase (glutamine-hydrolysing) [Marisediminitalea aggregata]|tara:strand:+ start:16418 stop:18085 length:1668 start_codon:yes stop_codon:yes gene_type:complete
MCGIFGILDIKTDVSELRTQALELTKTLRHRGPDWSGIWNNDNTILCHERLAIVDVDTGAQPLISDNGQQILAVNGEIYNHKQLAKDLATPYNFKTRSDCEVILPLYQQRGVEFIDDLQGMFAFVLYDEAQDSYLIARDHIGIIPLYTGYDEHGNFYVASEMKALAPVCKTISEFPPGHYMWSKTGELVKYYKRDWMEYDAVKDNETSIDDLREAFEKAVKSHLMSDVPYAVLLSGGLDSSLVSAVAAKYVAKRVEDEDKSDAWWPRLHSFAVGLEGAPDLLAAKKVADMIGTVHHEIHFTIQEGLDAIRDVIYHLETYDTTTIRAATPMYLMTRKIKAMGIKMVLSGEGSDEIFGGYLYFHKAPNAKEFHEETVRKLDRLHMFDCARANKATSAWGVEARVPFLDKEFMDVAMRLNPKDKMCGNGKMEKYILREAFDNGDTLPPEVLWRQKEQFGDGVGYSWIDSIKDFVENEVSDQQLASAEFRFPINTPDTKEGYYYRTIFEGYFPQETAARCVPGGKSIACSTVEALEWDESFKNNADPSGRSMKDVHGQS